MDGTRSETKYERLRKIGIGSYGVVFKCINRQTGQIVAIKRYSENDTDPIIRKIAMREVRMLRQLKHPNLIHLIEVFRRKRILHLVFDYCELTVLDVIEKYGSNCPLNLIRKIIWQLVNGVSHCHAHNCIHRDIKPENILINQSGVVKLCDFGFARNMSQAGRAATTTAANSMSAKQVKYEREAQLLGVSTNQMSRFMANNADQVAEQQQQQQQQMLENNKENQRSERLALTEYVATRWYRAPELLVGDVYYDKKVDIWAIGCVTAELMRGEPVWPGKTDLDQLFMIKSSLGPLTARQSSTLLAEALYDQASMERLLNQTNISDPLERKLPQRVGQAGLEFVFACLQMDPLKRPASDELLQHHYIHSAQMSQFVQGSSHTATAATGTGHSEQVSLGARAPSTRLSHGLLAGSNPDVRALSQQATPAGAARSNSQAILMMASNQQQQHQQQQQQPASKRLLIASDTNGSGGAGSSASTNESPRHGSLVPVPVRARQPEANPNLVGRMSWSQSDEFAQKQQARQLNKRKASQPAVGRSIAQSRLQQQQQQQQRRQSVRTEASRQSVALRRGSTSMAAANIGQHTGSNGITGHETAGPGQQTPQKARGAPGVSEASSQEPRRLPPGRPDKTARRDRQPTNFSYRSSHQNKAAPAGQDKQGGRVERQFAGTNPTGSPNSPLRAGKSSNATANSTAFLPPVQR